MSDIAVSPDIRPIPIPVRELLPWVLLGGVLLLLALYFVSTEEGAVTLTSGVPVHEFLHDGRHLLGFPCH
jgi:hypothetical protein